MNKKVLVNDRVIDYREQHRAMWQWLADNPKKGKTEWPGWKWFWDNGVQIDCYCFACDCAGDGVLWYCNHCPCTWSGTYRNPCLSVDGFDEADVRDHDIPVEEGDGEFWLWQLAQVRQDWDEVTRLALVIRDAWSEDEDDD